jgi:hypothetical protein
MQCYHNVDVEKCAVEEEEELELLEGELSVEEAADAEADAQADAETADEVEAVEAETEEAADEE